MSDPQPICANCQWWHCVSAQLGFCHGAPPTTFISEELAAQTVWPETRATDFCGMFKERSRP